MITEKSSKCYILVGRKNKECTKCMFMCRKEKIMFSHGKVFRNIVIDDMLFHHYMETGDK